MFIQELLQIIGKHNFCKVDRIHGFFNSNSQLFAHSLDGGHVILSVFRKRSFDNRAAALKIICMHEQNNIARAAYKPQLILLIRPVCELGHIVHGPDRIRINIISVYMIICDELHIGLIQQIGIMINNISLLRLIHAFIHRKVILHQANIPKSSKISEICVSNKLADQLACILLQHISINAPDFFLNSTGNLIHNTGNLFIRLTKLFLRGADHRVDICPLRKHFAQRSALAKQSTDYSPGRYVLALSGINPIKTRQCQHSHAQNSCSQKLSPHFLALL